MPSRMQVPTRFALLLTRGTEGGFKPHLGNTGLP